MALSGRQLGMTMKIMKSGKRHEPGSGAFEGHMACMCTMWRKPLRQVGMQFEVEAVTTVAVWRHQGSHQWHSMQTCSIAVLTEAAA